MALFLDSDYESELLRLVSDDLQEKSQVELEYNWNRFGINVASQETKNRLLAHLFLDSKVILRTNENLIADSLKKLGIFEFKSSTNKISKFSDEFILSLSFDMYNRKKIVFEPFPTKEKELLKKFLDKNLWKIIDINFLEYFQEFKKIFLQKETLEKKFYKFIGAIPKNILFQPYYKIPYVEWQDRNNNIIYSDSTYSHLLEKNFHLLKNDLVILYVIKKYLHYFNYSIDDIRWLSNSKEEDTIITFSNKIKTLSSNKIEIINKDINKIDVLFAITGELGTVPTGRNVIETIKLSRTKEGISLKSYVHEMYLEFQNGNLASYNKLQSKVKKSIENYNSFVGKTLKGSSLKDILFISTGVLSMIPIVGNIFGTINLLASSYDIVNRRLEYSKNIQNYEWVNFRGKL